MSKLIVWRAARAQQAGRSPNAFLNEQQLGQIAEIRPEKYSDLEKVCLPVDGGCTRHAVSACARLMLA